MLTFPPGAVCATSAAFPILFRARGIVALAKPAGVAVDEHPWLAGRATLCEELRARIAAGSASALALGIARPAPVAPPAAEISGVVLLADRADGSADAWRNALGSEKILFRFVFLAKPSAQISDDKFSCTLPIAPHFSEPRALVSRKTGKKSETRFFRSEKFGDYELWRAETTFPRPHQIRLHAAESSLPIVGDALYGKIPPVVNSAFRPRGRLNKGEERPIYDAICLHLEEIVVAANAVPELVSDERISAPLPDGFSALLKKFRARHSR